jgi:hypothetical protein
MDNDLHTPNCDRLWSGCYLDITNITPDSFTLEDVIIGLAREQRWNNQSFHPVSVGQHTLHCYELHPTFQTLLHDAPEGILGDITTSRKKLLPQYRVWEAQLYAVMCYKWVVRPDDFLRIDPQVKIVDREVLEWEWKNCVIGTAPLSDEKPWYLMNEEEVCFQLKHLFYKHIHRQNVVTK